MIITELYGVLVEWDRSEENGNEDGIVIWIGFFNTILEGCFSSEFQKNGIIECYFNQDYQTKSGRNVMEIIDMSTKRKLKKMVSVLFILGCFFIGNTKCKGADLEYISQENTPVSD